MNSGFTNEELSVILEVIDKEYDRLYDLSEVGTMHINSKALTYKDIVEKCHLMHKATYEEALSNEFTKECTSCKIPLTVDKYDKCKPGKYGVRGECKECRKDKRNE